ncbi:uncharacterized protein [Typha angustifolia]|uniref:uncharacterized protein n=1 Tax=Typha angustifolia TaxID=59011 RepID=UPI003C2FAAEE
MEEPSGFLDWELLPSSEADEKLNAFGAIVENESEDDGAIKLDYFALDSEKKYPEKATFPMNSEEGEEEEEGLCANNPSWVDPESYPIKGELGFSGIDFPNKDSVRLDESLDEQRSLLNSERRELSNGGDLDEEKKDVGLEEIAEIEEDKVAEKMSGEIGDDKIGLNETVNQTTSELSSRDSVVEMGNKEISPLGSEKKKEKVWWKLPLEVLNFCLFRMKPVWSISIAAAMIGFAMLVKRLYKMKQKSRSIPPLKISLDEKKESQFKARAARLNEAFSVVRRVPILRASLSASVLTPWPAVGINSGFPMS